MKEHVHDVMQCRTIKVRINPNCVGWHSATRINCLCKQALKVYLHITVVFVLLDVVQCRTAKVRINPNCVGWHRATKMHCLCEQALKVYLHEQWFLCCLMLCNAAQPKSGSILTVSDGIE
jgi:4-hydroxy-3-methylbut-2-en-1-yl diphosphate synthase IspG/GcpE